MKNAKIQRASQPIIIDWTDVLGHGSVDVAAAVRYDGAHTPSAPQHQNFPHSGIVRSGYVRQQT